MIFNQELHPPDKAAIVYEDKLNIWPQSYVSGTIWKGSHHIQESKQTPSPK